jgi:hypothetical protein
MACTQSFAQLLLFGTHPLMHGQYRQGLGPNQLLRCQTFQNRPEGFRGDLAENAGNFNVGRLQQTVNPVGNPIAILLYMYPATQQIAQFANFLWRNETGAYQSILEQFGNPRGIDTIGLVTRQCLDVLRIQQEQFQLAPLLQNVPHRTPVNSGALHGHSFDLMPDQPRFQFLQIFRESRKGGLDNLHTLSIHDAGAGENALLVNVQSRAAAVYYLDGGLLCRECRTQRGNRTFLRVLSALRQRRHSVVPCTT